MMFKPDAIIEFVSQFITLQEGDIIFTGTPSGVVLGKNEKRYGWLKSGDTVSISISSIGTLVNQFKLSPYIYQKRLPMMCLSIMSNLFLLFL